MPLKFNGSYAADSGPIQSFTFQAVSTDITYRFNLLHRLAVTPFTVTDGITSWTMTDGFVQVGTVGQNDIFVFVTTGFDFDQGDFVNGNGLFFKTFFPHHEGAGTYSKGAGDNAFFEQIINGNLRLLQSLGVVDLTATSSSSTITFAIPAGTAGGDQQTGNLRSLLTNPLVVKTTNPDGSTALGVSISFAITGQPPGATGAKLSVASGTTAADGIASTQLTLGDKPGQYQVTASCVAGQTCTPSSVVFVETATPPQLTLKLDQPDTQPSPASSVHYLDRATVTLQDQNGVAMQNQNVSFQVTISDLTKAGHAHTNFGSSLPGFFVDDSGLTATTCTTDLNGQCHLNYVVPEVSGDYSLTATFQNVTSLPQTEKVQVSGLVGVGTGDGFDTTPNVGGQTPEHPTNHFGTPLLAGTIIPSIGTGYIKATRGGILGINDMSLPLGGLFDLDTHWDNVGGHNLHRQGSSVDINRTQVDGTLVDVRTILRLVRAINAVPILERTPNCLGKYPFTPCIHIEVSP